MKQKKLANCLMNIPSKINNMFVFSLFCICRHVHVQTGRTDNVYRNPVPEGNLRKMCWIFMMVNTTAPLTTPWRNKTKNDCACFPQSYMCLFQSCRRMFIGLVCLHLVLEYLGGRAGNVPYKYKPVHHRQRAFKESLFTFPLKLPTTISLLPFFGSQDLCSSEREGRSLNWKLEGKKGEKLVSANVQDQKHCRQHQYPSVSFPSPRTPPQASFTQLSIRRL